MNGESYRLKHSIARRQTKASQPLDAPPAQSFDPDTGEINIT
jgi:hypothetical protein